MKVIMEWEYAKQAQDELHDGAHPLFPTFHLFYICQNILLFNMNWDAKNFQMSVTLVKPENSYIQPRKLLYLCFKSRWCGKIKQPAFARVTAKRFWNMMQLKRRGVLENWHEISPQEGGCPAPCIKVGRYFKCLKKNIKVFFFLESCSTSFLNSITEQSVIKSAEKVNAQCISNEALLIALL